MSTVVKKAPFRFMLRRAAFILAPSSANGFREAWLLLTIVPIEMLHPGSIYLLHQRCVKLYYDRLKLPDCES
jgi:hypothetical protein